jgi:hypothetical protein
MTPLQVSFSAFYFCFLLLLSHCSPHTPLFTPLHSVLYIRTNQHSDPAKSRALALRDLWNDAKK